MRGWIGVFLLRVLVIFEYTNWINIHIIIITMQLLWQKKMPQESRGRSSAFSFIVLLPSSVQVGTFFGYVCQVFRLLFGHTATLHGFLTLWSVTFNAPLLIFFSNTILVFCPMVANFFQLKIFLFQCWNISQVTLFYVE